MPIAKRVVTLATSRLTVLADGPRPGNILCSQFRTTRLALGWYRCSVQQGNGYGRVVHLWPRPDFVFFFWNAQISFDRASSSWRSCVATKFFFVEFEKGTRSDLPPTSSRLWKLRRNPRSLVDSIEPSRQATHSVPFVAATERGQLQTRRCGRTGIKNSESKWKGFLYVLGEM